MQDLNVALILLGAIVTFVYLRYNQPYRPRENGESPVRRSSFVGFDIPDPKKLFILQYEQINQHLRIRESINIVTGALFLSASILLFSSTVFFQQGMSPLFVYLFVFSSVVLYSIWLLALNLPTNIISSRDLYQLRQMEKETEYGLTMHTSLWENMKNTTWDKYFKRQAWILPFWVLVAAAIATVHGVVV